jgi:cytochrome c oxidase cbb3-type subunit 3
MMPSFDWMSPEEVTATATYVASLSGDVENQELVSQGEELFAQNCAACHGEDAKGQNALGAPNLTDAIWLYGDGVDNIRSQLLNPQHGVMPPWQGRLEESTIKMLTVYVHQLGGGQ